MSVIKNIELREQIARVWKLSVPAILTQITSIMMQYIDSAMVGNLGAGACPCLGTAWYVGGHGGGTVYQRFASAVAAAYIPL